MRRSSVQIREVAHFFGIIHRVVFQLQASRWYNLRMKKCLRCGKEFSYRYQKKFCSNRCQIDFQYDTYIGRWKKGLNNGSRGIETKDISLHLKKYLVLKFKEKCSKCGWSEKNPITGKVPLEVDHIDGNASNNAESNLRLLCPNCHSLTPFFRNLNKGNGRVWRKDKYIKIEK